MGRAAAAGDLESLDQWTRVPRHRRPESAWCRMALKLVSLWKLKDFDSTLGYPGEGPAFSKHAAPKAAAAPLRRCAPRRTTRLY